MIDQIVSFDQYLLLKINGLNGPLLDQLMYWLSHKWIWIPMYALILASIYRIVGFKKSLLVLLIVAGLITLSDQLSVHLFKEQFQRLRPCHDPSIKDQLILLNGKCGGLYGFLSSHASNTMALVIFLLLSFGKYWKGWAIPLAVWCALVGVSRIYLGVHFPTDVFAGWIFGSLLGIGGAIAFKKLTPRIS